jgi:hypothetical protein
MLSLLVVLLATVPSVVPAAVMESLHVSLLPPAVDLRVDLMDAQVAPLMVVTAVSRPSFSFVAPPAPPGPSVPMSAYRVVVTDLGGTVAWDSGRRAGRAAVNVECSTSLKSGLSYTWTAQ